MTLLVALLLAQNVNVTPIEVRVNGARLPTTQRQYVIDCRTNMTCAIDGGILFLSASGGSGGGSSYDGGKVAEAYMADASITAQVAQAAYSADASVYTAAFDHEPAACPAGQYASDLSAAGVLTCSTPSGGGGAGNFAEAQVVLTASGFFSQTVAASWVTASSRVICGVLGTNDAGLTPEVVAVAGLGVSVSLLNPGVGFTVSLLNLRGIKGTVAVHCTGG